MSDKYYAIGSSSNVEEYLSIGSGLADLQKPCAMSEFQYLDKDTVSIEVEVDSGTTCQDFIYEHGVPLISDKVKRFFDSYGIDYLFYKKIILKKSSVGMEEPYWLALPPRINCLNFEQSEIDEFLNAADEIVIDSRKIGRYDIFKLSGVTNLEIIVTKKLALALKEEKFIGMHIYQIDERGGN